MPANTAPIFVLTPKNTWGANISTANTATDGTGTVITACTAGADGAFINSISVRALGTNVATVIRVFINNGSTNATPLNNALIEERTLPATTGSNVAALAPIDIPIMKMLQNGYRLNITIGTAVASGYAVVAWGGDY